MDYYSQNVKEVLRELNSSEKGLSTKEAEKRLSENGANELVKLHKVSWFKRFLAQFQDLLIIILIVAAVLSAFFGDVNEALIIAFIVLLNAVIGFIQEYNAEKAVEALRKMISPKAIAVRDGKEIEIEVKNLVPGDVIVLEEGSKIPADARLFEEVELEVDEAILTGESVPRVKDVKELKQDLTVADEDNMIFMGTVVTHGRGRAVVTHTGMKTEIGKIAHMTQEIKEEQSPLQKELVRVGKFIAKAAIAICVLIFIVGIFQGENLMKMLIFSISLAVAAVPEGLPTTVTIALSIGVQKMARKKAIVKKLSSVETLGSTTVICSDKTGTLTKNEMTAKQIYFDNKDFEVTGVGYIPQGKFYYKGELLNEKEVKKLHSLFEISILCNNSSLRFDEKHKQWKITGDPTEAALITAGEKSGLNSSMLKEKYPRVHEIPFDSKTKRMTVICKRDKKAIAYVKGAPDIILDLCDKIEINGKVETLTPARKKEILKKNQEMAEKALRVLGFAYKNVEGKYRKEDVEKKLVFAGLMGMIDPPRDEVKDAVEVCKKAGIKVVMITGDHGITAKAVAKQIGLDAEIVMTGADIEKLTDVELMDVLEKEIIFARVLPKHKLRIVSLLQKKGHIVAVTGDGVNDAPALKKASIGVAVGSGTDVAKEASTMVLTDDSFATIVAAVREGRSIYDNIKKFLRYIFSSNLGEIFTIVFGMLLKLPLPLTAAQILWVNVGTDVLPALALSVEPTDKDVMDRKPRNPRENIISRENFINWLISGLVIGAGVISIFVWQFKGTPDSLLKAQTMAFCLLVMYQMVNVFACRSAKESAFKKGLFSNMWLIGAVVVSILLQLIVVQVEFFNKYFNTVPLSLWEWSIIVLASLSLLLVDEIRKIVEYRNNAE